MGLLYFPKIEKDTSYTIIIEDGRTILKAEANGSASGIVHNKRFNVFKTPIMKWKWKISNTLKYAVGINDP